VRNFRRWIAFSERGVPPLASESGDDSEGVGGQVECSHVPGEEDRDDQGEVLHRRVWVGQEEATSCLLASRNPVRNCVSTRYDDGETRASGEIELGSTGADAGHVQIGPRPSATSACQSSTCFPMPFEYSADWNGS
jgi:hypothetical protein